MAVRGDRKLGTHHLNVDAVQLVGQVEGEGDSPQVLLGEVHGQRELGRAEATISINISKLPIDNVRDVTQERKIYITLVCMYTYFFVLYV